MSHLTDRLKTAIADRYVIEREIGEGGMATVYLARDVRHDRQVALKVLRPELAAVIGAERFLQEIKVTANLQHPHILPLHDSGEVNGTVYYVMPYVEGESLRDRITREQQLPVGEAVRIASEVADALHYAHGHGVVHRDIKPENILLHGGHAMVADFGIALAVSRSDGGTRMTETGMSLGTPHYMSPEQAMGEREITPRADVYALGCVLYEMLTGEPPFTGPTAQAIIARVMTEDPRSLTLQRRTVPPHVEAAVETALAKLPADRFVTAQEFARALRDPDVTLTTRRSAAPATTERRVSSPGRRWGWAAATALAVIVAGWGWIRVLGAPTPPVTRQYISLGDSARLWTETPSLALSPDGNRLVFKEDRQDGLLWVKDRDQLDPTPLAGTQRAQNPVFSPDGEWVAFVADGQLKKVRSSGGATVTLADSAAAGFGGAAWMDDGTIVYVTPTLNRLHRVNETGGTSTVALHDTSWVGGGIGQPAPLPGGHGVLFQWCSSGCVTMAIHVADLRTGTQRLLVDDAAQAWYLPTGHVLYVRRDGVAMAAPFDLDALEITGEAVPVVEDVAVRGGAGFAPLAWSPAGVLVYVRGILNSADNLFVRVRRDGTTSPLDTAWYGAFNSFAAAPDGRRIAVGVGAGSGLNIWIKQLDGGPFTRLTFGNQDRRPVWSPDGRRVAFIRDSANTSAVFARPEDGSGPDTLLARIDRQIQEVDWSPDGRWLILRTDNATAGAGDLVGVRLDTQQEPVPLVASRFSELHPAVSPDGRWLAYTSNESSLNEIYVRPFPDTQAARWQVSNGGGIEAVWSEDGRTLFYLDAVGSVQAATVDGGGTMFAVGRVVTLFSAASFTIDSFHQSFDVLLGGDLLFLSPRQLTVAGAAPRIVLVENWFHDLRARLER